MSFLTDYDYHKGLDTATRTWARERLRQNAQQGPYERPSSNVIADINTLRHAYGLDVLRVNASHDGLEGDPGALSAVPVRPTVECRHCCTINERDPELATCWKCGLPL